MIADLVNLSEHDADVVGKGKPFYCQLMCEVAWIFLPLDVFSTPMFYLACQSCRRKVVDAGNCYECAHCTKTFEDALPIFNFSVLITDCSGSIRVQCFGEVGEAVLGMTGVQFYRAYHENMASMQELRSLRLFTPLSVTVKAKLD